MKHLYSKPSFLFIITSPAIRSKLCSQKSSVCKRIILAIVVLILLPLISVAQTTFTAVNIGNGSTATAGNWKSAEVWGTVVENGATLTAGVHYPGAKDTAVIEEGVIVTVVEANRNATCSKLVLEPANRGASDGAKLIIGGTLQVDTLQQLNTASFQKIPSLEVQTGGHLKIYGAFDMGVSASRWVDYTFADSSTVEYNGTNPDQVIESRLYYKNLIFSGSGTKTVISPLNVLENFTIDSAAVFDEATSSYTHTIGGNWTNNATFIPGSSTILLTGSLASLTQVKVGGSSPTTFHNFSVELPIGVNKSAMLNNDITVNSNLSLSNGVLQTGSGALSDYYLITLASNASLISTETDNVYIKGRIATQRTVSSAGAELFGNIGFKVVSNSATPETIRIERVTGFALSSIDGTQTGVPRYFDVQQVGSGSTTGLGLAMDFSFLDMELQPQSGTPPLSALTLDNYVLVRETERFSQKFTKPGHTKVSDTPPTVQNVNEGVFTRYTLANRLTPLPVELVWFRAELREGDVLLTWQTGWELENRGFEVQESADGESFTGIGFVESGSPTKTGAQSYSFLRDGLQSTGRRYYRLAQHDLDGTVNYSSVRSVEVRGGGSFTVYPNPFQDELTVMLPATEPCTVVITNQLGKQVYSTRINNGHFTTNLSNVLPDGVFYLSIQTADNSYTCRIVKQ